MHKYEWWYKHFNKAWAGKTVNLSCKVESWRLCVVFPSQRFADLSELQNTQQPPKLKSLQLRRHLLLAFINTKHIHIKGELATGKMQLHVLKAKHNWAEYIIKPLHGHSLYSNLTFGIQTTVENFTLLKFCISLVFVSLSPIITGFKYINNGLISCNGQSFGNISSQQTNSLRGQSENPPNLGKCYRNCALYTLW